jgi:protein tyrosine phosphatase (PTP) superfamily phosphohydrolase (DUF442 family)
MDTVQQITDELAIARQPTLEEMQQLLSAGYRSVVNLRSAQEVGFLETEQSAIEYLGLCYIHLTLPKTLDLNSTLAVVQQLRGLPKPLLLHCDSGMRSAIVAMMYLAIGQGIRAEAAFQRVTQLGLLSH